MAAGSPPLTKERIVDEAIALLDENGVRGLSMRALALRLGASTMATYHHVADKDALVEAIANRIIGNLAEPVSTAGWQDIIRTMAWSFRDLALAHPGAFTLMLAREDQPDALLQVSAATISRLIDCGFTPEEASDAFRTFVRFLIGSILAEERTNRYEIEDASKALFDFGIETLIRGIESR